MFSDLKVTSSTQLCSDLLDSSFLTDLTWIGAEGSRGTSTGTKHAIAAVTAPACAGSTSAGESCG